VFWQSITENCGILLHLCSRSYHLSNIAAFVIRNPRTGAGGILIEGDQITRKRAV
jgi:hypothetical protein